MIKAIALYVIIAIFMLLTINFLYEVPRQLHRIAQALEILTCLINKRKD